MATAIAKNVIGSSAKFELISILKSINLSILSDESTDVSSKKHTSILVRYYCSKDSKIVSSFFSLVDLFKDNESLIASSEIFF